MDSTNLITKILIFLILLLNLSYMISKDLSFLEENSKNSNNTPIECYLEAINLVKTLKTELETKFEVKEAELQKIWIPKS